MNAKEFVPQWRDDDGVLYSRWRVDYDDDWPSLTMHFRCLRALQPLDRVVLRKCSRANTVEQSRAQRHAFKGPIAFSVEQVVFHNATSRSVGTITLRLEDDDDLRHFTRQT